MVTIGVSAQPFGRMSSTEQAEQITKQLTHELKLDTKQSKRVKKIYTTLEKEYPEAATSGYIFFGGGSILRLVATDTLCPRGF